MTKKGYLVAAAAAFAMFGAGYLIGDMTGGPAAECPENTTRGAAIYGLQDMDGEPVTVYNCHAPDGASGQTFIVTKP